VTAGSSCGKSDPTDTDKAIVNWLAKNNIYYEVVTDVPDSMDDIYERRGRPQRQAEHQGARPAQHQAGRGRGRQSLSLFVSNDEQVEEDRWLTAILEAV
jgi:hypothetical protein